MRRIFVDYADGLAPRTIAAALNAEGVPSPRGGKWNDSTSRGHARKRDGFLRNEAFVGVIVYGRNKWSRDPDTDNRISRPGDAADIVCGERPELQIVDDDTWNAVQDRLEATHTKFARACDDSASLNGSHRARSLLSRLVTCDLLRRRLQDLRQRPLRLLHPQVERRERMRQHVDSVAARPDQAPDRAFERGDACRAAFKGQRVFRAAVAVLSLSWMVGRRRLSSVRPSWRRRNAECE